jgi:hypothetical protein
VDTIATMEHRSSSSLLFCLTLIWPAAARGAVSCHQRALGLEDVRVQDSQLSASSSFQPAVGPAMGRLNADIQGGAWCPRSFISQELDMQEFLEVDLLQEHTITGVLTQGRFAGGQGQEYAEYFTLQYWREGMETFANYVDVEGAVRVLQGNVNTFTPARVELDSPILASKIRILPYSHHPRTVCMRVELLGCKIPSEPLSSATSKISSALTVEAKVSAGFSLIAAVLGGLLTLTSLLVIILVLVLLRSRRNSLNKKLGSSLSDISISGSIYQQQQQGSSQQGSSCPEPVYQEPRTGPGLCAEYASPLSLASWTGGSVYNIYQAPGDSSCTDLSYLEESSVDSASSLGTPRLPPLPDFDKSPYSTLHHVVYVNQSELLQSSL